MNLFQKFQGRDEIWLNFKEIISNQNITKDFGEQVAVLDLDIPHKHQLSYFI